MIKEQDMACQILEMMNTGIKGAECLYRVLENGNLDAGEQLWEDIYSLILSLEDVSSILKKEESGLNLPAATASIGDTLVRVRDYAKGNDVEKALNKIQFELLPLMEEMRGNFYFWGMVYPDQEKMEHYYRYEMFRYFRNRYVEEAEKTGQYKYDLSIMVLAYNKLEYTKMCVESLLKYLPEDLKYELILLNHGSTDGTKEYFESIHPDKQMDILVNGGGMGAIHRIEEGRYSLHISNDVLVTPNAIQNMLRCIQSDKRIAWVVPTTPNVSNFQTIPLEYENIGELWEATEKNNISDPYRWEQRVRLCNPIDLYRNDVFHKLCINGYIFSKNALSFPDDKISLLFRRRGYKLMLVNDAYCYHFGSLTLGNMQKENVLQGRREFLNAFGVDPWGRGLCWDWHLFHSLPCDKAEVVKVLGINCGLGSNSLKIKESLKENVHNTEVTLYNYTMEMQYESDLAGISDEVKVLASWGSFEGCVHEEKFDYILIENGLEQEENYQEILGDVLKHLNNNGFMIVKFGDSEKIEWIRETFQNIAKIKSDENKYWWLYWKNHRCEGDVND